MPNDAIHKINKRACNGNWRDLQTRNTVHMKYSFYHGLGLKAFEGCHIRIINNNNTKEEYGLHN
jgi:hypothetical protein